MTYQLFRGKGDLRNLPACVDWNTIAQRFSGQFSRGRLLLDFTTDGPCLPRHDPGLLINDSVAVKNTTCGIVGFDGDVLLDLGF
jgi:hypothetical protein